MTTQDPHAALGRFLRRTGGLTVRVEDGREYVRVPSEWIDDLAAALAAALAATPSAIDPERLRCEKCGGTDIGTQWHQDTWAGRGRPTCSWAEQYAEGPAGEHLHHYCRTCQFQWRAAIIAAHEADPAPPVEPPPCAECGGSYGADIHDPAPGHHPYEADR